MTSPSRTEVYKQFQTGQEKYVYFLLAASASAIGLAVQQTRVAALGWSQLPLAAAVVLWGVSFYAGCRGRSYTLSALYTNFGMLTAQDGAHPIVQQLGNHPDAIRIFTEESHKIMERQSNAAGFWTILQFRLLICGAMFYLAWHVLEMVRRVPC
jgi:hypothetical protein